MPAAPLLPSCGPASNLRPFMSWRILSYVFLLGLAGLLSPLSAQEGTAEGERRMVRTIEIIYQGYPSVSESLIRDNIQLRPGQPFDQAMLDRSIRSLYRTNFFDQIDARVREVGANEVDVIFNVLTKYRLTSITFEGNEKFSDNRLQKEIELETGDFIDAFEIDRAADTLLSFYLKKGFSNAEVDFAIERNDETGQGAVVFRIDAGERIRIGRIRFEGVEGFSARKLRSQIDSSQRKWWISWLDGSGRFDADNLALDREDLLTFFRNEGFLDVEVPESEVEVEYRKPNVVDLTFRVDLGRQYSVGTVSVSGNTIFPAEEILNAAGIRSGQVFSPEKVGEAAEAIRLFYGEKGYLETRVFPERRPNLETGAIDLNFAIRESGRFEVQSVNIDGNTKTKSIVIIREISLRPGETFDLRKMRASQTRLRNTQFFESVELRPAPTNVPDRRDLNVLVQEAPTGSISFGAGFSSVESLIFFAEVSQSNFDLFNWRSFFQGDGQKFRLRAAIGSQSNEIVLTFEEPWLFNQRLALGLEVFRRQTDFQSSDYNELRTGFSVYLRKRLFELVEGRLKYQLEDVDIFDVDDDASSAIKDEEGNTTISLVGLAFLRDTRDDLLLTRRGNRVNLDNEVAGGVFGGDVDYLKNDLRTSQFFPTFEFLNQGVAFFGRTGVLTPYDDSDVPFFNRFFLGGPNNMRGFPYRKVGPVDENNEPIGGKTYGYLSAEYLVQLLQPLEFVLFYDWGFLNEDEWDYDFSSYNDDWGFGFRILILGAPLRLDFGFPITAEDYNDEGTQFNFSFGTRF